MNAHTSVSSPRFANRREAGRRLATALADYSLEDTVVFALTRGGVEVAFEVATALSVPLDFFLVRELVPQSDKSLVMGAVTSGEGLVVDPEAAKRVPHSNTVLREVIESERLFLLQRETIYRKGRAHVAAAGKTVLLVDDGSESTRRIAWASAALRDQEAAKVVAAIPVIRPETRHELAEWVDEVVCLAMPESLVSVGQHYVDFTQTSDQTVCLLLEDASAIPRTIAPPVAS